MIDVVKPHPHLPSSAIDVVRAAISAPRRAIWAGCCTEDVRHAEEAIRAQGMLYEPGVPFMWWRSCPLSGGPECGCDFHPAKPTCSYCHGRGFCTGAPSSVADFVSVYAHGAERLAGAEALARTEADALGVRLSAIAWQVVSARDVATWKPYAALRRAWCAPFDVGVDADSGIIVLGVERVLVADHFDERIIEEMRARFREGA